MKTQFWNLICREQYKKVLLVKSLIPQWDKHLNAISWPTLLIDSSGGQRQTVSPVWTRKRLFKARNKNAND